MRTRANIGMVARNIRSDLVDVERMPGPTKAQYGVMGTLAVNLKVFAAALDEEREGRKDFVGGVRPSECVSLILGRDGNDV